MPRKGAPRRRRRSTARPVSAAAARAVERILASPDTFALLVRRLEAAGWHVEREPGRETSIARPERGERGAPQSPARER
jgi:hypothetical protein